MVFQSNTFSKPPFQATICFSFILTGENVERLSAEFSKNQNRTNGSTLQAPLDLKEAIRRVLLQKWCFHD